jgi:hypothetical protein
MTRGLTGVDVDPADEAWTLTNLELQLADGMGCRLLRTAKAIW